MKKYIFLIFSFVISFAKIVEISNIDEAEKYISENSLVIFDLDNTIMEPKGQLGSDQWFYSKISDLKKRGFTDAQALEKVLDMWYKIQSISSLQLVEKNTKEFVDKITKTNLYMALTTRGYMISYSTIKNLKDLGIDFSNTKVHSKDVFFNNPKKGVLFHKGILFTGNTDKGKALFKFLRKTKYKKPPSVIFINDKKEHLQQVEKEAKKRKIDYVGLRYAFLDPKVKSLTKNTIAINEINFQKFIDDLEKFE